MGLVARTTTGSMSGIMLMMKVDDLINRLSVVVVGGTEEEAARKGMKATTHGPRLAIKFEEGVVVPKGRSRRVEVAREPETATHPRSMPRRRPRHQCHQ